MPSDPISETPEYGKMPVWQWVTLYLVVGIIIYGLFYSFMVYKKATTPYTGSTQPISEEVGVDLGQESETEDVIYQNITEVLLTDEEFTPNVVTITVGSTVTFTNNSSGTGTVNSAVHPTHDDYLPLNLGSFEPGESLSLTFDTVGTYKYHNHLNPTQIGTIEVVTEENLGVEDEQALTDQEEADY